MATQTSDLKSDPRPSESAEERPKTPSNAPEIYSSPSNPVMLRKLYATMLRCRMVEQRAIDLNIADKVTLQAKATFGREATAVGSLIELRPGDAMAGASNMVTQLLRGTPLPYLFAQLFGFEERYRAASPGAESTPILQIPATTTVEAQLNIAAGVALDYKHQQRSNVVVIELPDGFSALGFWHEAARLAVAERLALVFVVNSDSSFASQTPAQFESELRDRAEAYGMPGITVDGNDVVAIWRVTQESIYRGRSGTGPTLIDCRQGHRFPVSAKKIAEPLDPLAHMQHYLKKRRLWETRWKDEMVAKFAAEIDEAVSFSARIARTQ